MDFRTAKMNQGHRNRFTARSVFIPQSQPAPMMEEEEYYEPEPDPVMIMPKKKKSKDLPGQALLRKIHRERMKQRIEEQIAKLSVREHVG